MSRVPRLLAIVDLAGHSQPNRWLTDAKAAGVSAVWSRDRPRPDRVRLTSLEAITRAGLRALASGRPDLCVAADGAGVHLPADGLPVAAIRSLLPTPALVGRSTHSIVEVARARDEGVDYVVFGPIWATPGKGRPLGPEALHEACRLGVPILALGGIDLTRLGEVAQAGAAGVAGIRFCADSTTLLATAAAVAAAFGPIGSGPARSSIIPP